MLGASKQAIKISGGLEFSCQMHEEHLLLSRALKDRDPNAWSSVALHVNANKGEALLFDTPGEQGI